MWDLPGPGLEPLSPALAGGFLTTVPPGKPFPELFHHPNPVVTSCETVVQYQNQEINVGAMGVYGSNPFLPHV